MSASDWIAPLIGLASTIGAGLIVHAVMDAYKQGRMESKIEKLEEQVGSHDSGLIGSLHKQKNQVSGLKSLMYFIADKIGINVKKDDE